MMGFLLPGERFFSPLRSPWCPLAVVFLVVFVPFVLPSFLQPCEAVFFESGPNAKDCFYFEGRVSQIVVGFYETFFGADSHRVTIDHSVGENSNEKPEQLYYSYTEAGHFKVDVPKDGQYAFCFRNLLSYDQTVTFNLRVQASHEVHPQELATKDETHRLGELAIELQEKIEELADQQSQGIAREAIHRDITESTNSRVMWWTVLQVVTLVLLSGFQVYYIASFFEVKSIV